MSKNAHKVILLVEDNEDDVFLTRIALKRIGVQNLLHVVTDGQQAIDYLSGAREFADRNKYPYPSLILLDLQLPYRSGFDILAWVRQQTNLPPAVVAVLTGSNEPKDLTKARELGASTYLVKPPTTQMIYDLVKTFELDWLQCNASESLK